ncbi:phosphatase PAP2 family protein [uncultured Bifidobacterium sp.]|uniref:phosphatase PAP2 family protein n=1 Tax=uncultured Bifidobacterium sp. TaxID=165187 RepID=UPI0028DBAEBB|nr:phosphatase PAP2 family protein [uncultured Bifidobacterium sp.]
MADDGREVHGHRMVPDDDAEVRLGLSSLDPLVVRPRVSARVACLLLGLLLVGLAFAAWWVGVRTMDGQAFEDMVWSYLPSLLPAVMRTVVGLVARSAVVIALSAAFAIVGVACAIFRRRWWLLGQMVVLALLGYAATWLKSLLVRPMIIETESRHLNSAPSGHVIMAALAGAALLMAVPRVARALAAVLATLLTSVVGLSVLYGQWHRPVDVLMSLLLVAGLCLVVLAGTRTSGMDPVGGRASSTAIQIIGSVLVTAGLVALVYGVFIIWQILPGLDMSAAWARSGAVLTAEVLVVGVCALTSGLVLAMRQVTASPLSKIGLIGAPPAPPRP